MNNLRQIVLDTETTGISHEDGHRIIEIGCLELIDRKLTGSNYHVYINPMRKVDEGAFRVHGISSEFLEDKPVFTDIINDFLQYIDGSTLIIHNAPFDVGFLNAELKRAKSPKILADFCDVIDTLVIAREKHRGMRNNLDALCKRYEVDNSSRKFHGALLDAEILAHVYLAMTGGQANLFIDEDLRPVDKNLKINEVKEPLSSNSKVLLADKAELAKHHEFIEFLIKKSGKNLWVDEKNNI